LESRNLLTSHLCPPTSTLRHPSDSNRRAGGKEIRRSLLESRNLPTSHLYPPTSTLRPPSDSNRRAGGKEIRGFYLEIALAVCDGVLQISITVAKPAT
jgi:hypothetical protein